MSELRNRIYKFDAILLAFFLIFAALHYAASFLIPVTFAALLAMLMLPVCRKLENLGMNRGLAVFICDLIIFIAVAAVLFLISTQLPLLAQDLPQFKSKIEGAFSSIQQWVQQSFGISGDQFFSSIRSGSSSFFSKAASFLQKSVMSLSVTLFKFILVLIYFFLFLYVRDKYEVFILKLVPENQKEHSKKVIADVAKVSEQYLTGRLLVMLILAVLNAVALLILGVKHAIFLGALAALLTIVPYIGTFIGYLFPFTIALINQGAGTALAVVGALVVIQLIDTYILEPKIVGGKVHISPLATIMVVIVGELIWGIAGMILFIPLLAIVKIIFDNINGLKPFGYLIGDQKEK